MGTEESSVTFTYRFEKPGFVRASLFVCQRTRWWGVLFFGCLALAVVWCIGWFCVAAYTGMSAGGDVEDSDAGGVWTAIVLAFGAAAILAAPLVTARALSYRNYRRATDGRDVSKVTLDPKFMEVTFAGRSHCAPFEEAPRLAETGDVIIVGDLGLAKDQLDDDTIARIRSMFGATSPDDATTTGQATDPAETGEATEKGT